MTQPHLTLEGAKTLLVEIVESSPHGKRNAMTSPGSAMCAYLNSKGERCIVGEMLHRLGMPKPTEIGFALAGNDFVDKGYMDRETKEWLSNVQRIFDQGKWRTDGLHYAPITWRQALVKVRKEGLLP